MIVNLYEFLEIKPNATQEEVLTAITRAETFGRNPKLILASKNLLSDAQRRKQYNESLKRQLAASGVTFEITPRKIEVSTPKPLELTDANLWVPESIEDIQKRVHKQDMQVFAVIGLVVLCFVSFLIFKWNSNSDARAFRNMQYDSSFTCAELAKKRVLYPATFEQTSTHRQNQKWIDEGGGRYSLAMPFSANNAFNVPIEHIAICLVDANLGVKIMTVF